MGPPEAPGANDPRPVPPREPAVEECCQRGCEPCVFDRYYDALERYREALALWLDRPRKLAMLHPAHLQNNKSLYSNQ